MRKKVQWWSAPLSVGLAGALLSGCGTNDGGSGTDARIVMGMTDEVTAIDPASGYDVGSWLLFNNVFQTLLSFPSGGLTPQSEVAEQCSFMDRHSRVYTCTLKDNLAFSNRNPLTSKDVKHSFDRTLRINDPNGPAFMLESIEKIRTPDEKTVVFQLKHPDATFPLKIASGAGSIVDHRVYPEDELLVGHKPVGSGVYTLEKINDKEAVFSANSYYRGPAKRRNSGVTLEFFHGEKERLERAVERGQVDLAYRGLTTDAIADLQTAAPKNGQDVKVVEGTSAEVMHMVFNMKDPVTSKDGVRRAIAYLVDRSMLVRDVHKRTVEPLYSIIPEGITGHKTAFFDRYGERPQYDKAAAALFNEGITDKVKLTLWSTPERYGPATDAAFTKIAEQLNASGLFKAKVKSVDWPEYQNGVRSGRYAVYARAWVPDYPDPDNFTAPFFGPNNVLENNYEARRITQQLLPRTAEQSNRAATAKDFGRLQDIVARDVPLLPLWQDKQYAVARNGIDGLQWSLDASTVFRFWEISKAGS